MITALQSSTLAQDWVLPATGLDHDVVVIGGGQSGVAIASALRRAGVARVIVFEANEDPEQFGIWTDTARMRTLRTPKTLAGPDMGVEGLSFRSWFERAFSADAYAALERIDRLSWAKYLSWLRDSTGVVVEYGHRVTAVSLNPSSVELAVVQADGQHRAIDCRYAVLATGFLGSGAPSFPAVLRKALPAHALRHTSESLDFAEYSGKRVAIIGAAASAFDAAGEALERGAAEVRLFARRPALAGGTRWRFTGYEGFDSFFHLPDALKWKVQHALRQYAPQPPTESVTRATQHSNFHLHLGADVVAARWEEERAHLQFLQGEYSADVVIAGTGFSVELAARPELSQISDRIVTWDDRFMPGDDQLDSALGRYPYLGKHFEFLDRLDDPAMSRIRCYNAAAVCSHGRIVGDITSMKYGLPVLVNGLLRSLLLENANVYVDRIVNAELEHELDPRTWQSAVSVL
ncbi:hypothetical protein CCOS865_04065 [Pseudomonas reidholzensis]|uniref:Uncharacterized protein n=1 Tax=Pseudomonas reidholzensis TaxID=1785162 RepID=A0A383RY18_9PSED|nr:NAD(P)/FAD-dependent oxidoreductase [Pseudomonas reidholzensis]SYX91785.1 hypothetical protein CCOS865_04065 [Pseudomonas reidholzensis]